MGRTTGLLSALVSAVADTFYEVSGFLMTRTTAAYVTGATALEVKGLHRWPASGRFIVRGLIGNYAGRTDTQLVDITDADGAPGLPTDIKAGSVVLERSQGVTAMDALRRGFLLADAEEEDLEIYGQNYGLPRPGGISVEQLRGYLRVRIYGPTQTLQAFRRVLDAVLGSDGYELWEDLIQSPLTVYVTLADAETVDPHGSAYLTVTEERPRDSTYVVFLGERPDLVYGIYDVGDFERTGTNYAMGTLVCATSNLDPELLQSSLLEFRPADLNTPVWIGNERWYVVTFVDSGALRLGWPAYTDGSTSSSTPAVFTTDSDPWMPWVVGHKLEILTGSSAGLYPIEAVLSSRSVQVAGGSFGSEVGVSWSLRPAFETAVDLDAQLLRTSFDTGTFALTTIVALPEDMLVDYTTVSSAQVVNHGADAEAQYAFYLSERGNVMQIILDDIKAAGVRVVVEEES